MHTAYTFYQYFIAYTIPFGFAYLLKLKLKQAAQRHEFNRDVRRKVRDNYRRISENAH